MPIYEYKCRPCEHTFETLVRSSGDTPHCPKCGGIELAKQFSVPAAAQAAGSALPISSGPPMNCGAGGCGGGMCGMG